MSNIAQNITKVKPLWNKCLLNKNKSLCLLWPCQPKAEELAKISS